MKMASRFGVDGGDCTPFPPDLSSRACFNLFLLHRSYHVMNTNAA